jgi:catechol 2,3-dioxygenase-like lactoylglutathione lyase family enzyme
VRSSRLSLLVFYTERLEECRQFYTGLGLELVREQHGVGPVHYAAELPGGLVLELYPGRTDATTGRLRLGLVVAATSALPVGEHRLSDPDDRVVVAEAVELAEGRCTAAGA